MRRLRYNNAGGLLGTALAADAGPDTIDFGAVPSFATLVAPDYIPLVIDPPTPVGPNASFEVVWVTAYTAGQSTGTIARAQEATTAHAHAAGARWECASTSADGDFLQRNTNVVAASGAAQTIPDPLSAGVTENALTLSAANCSLTFPAADYGKRFRVALQQDSTGARTVTWPSVRWAGAGAVPALSTSPGRTDIFEFLCLDGSAWLGWTVAANVAGPPGPAFLTGQATANQAANGTTAIVIPGTTQVGDVMLLAVVNPGSVGTGSTPAAPAGWSTVVAALGTSNGQSFVAGALYSKTAVTGDPGSTVTVPAVTSGVGYVCHLRTYTSAGIDVPGSAVQGTGGAGTSASPISLTPGQTQEVEVTFFGVRGNTNAGGGNVITWGAGGSSETTFAGTGALDCWVAGEDAAAGSGAGAYGATVSYNNNQPAYVIMSVLLKPHN